RSRGPGVAAENRAAGWDPRWANQGRSNLVSVHKSRLSYRISLTDFADVLLFISRAQKSGLWNDDLRIRASEHGRADACLARCTAPRGWLREGLRGKGVRGEDRRQGRAWQGAQAAPSGRRVGGDAPRQACAINTRPAQHSAFAWRALHRVQVSGRCLGRHHYGAWPAAGDHVGRHCRVREGIDQGADQRPQSARQSAWRAYGPTTEAHAAPASGGYRTT